MAQQLDWYGSTGKDNRHERALAEGVAFWQQQVQQVQHLRAQLVETRKREDAACSVACFPVPPEHLAMLEHLSAERQFAARALALAVDNWSDERHIYQLASYESGDDPLGYSGYLTHSAEEQVEYA